MVSDLGANICIKNKSYLLAKNRDMKLFSAHFVVNSVWDEVSTIECLNKNTSAL